MTQTDTPRRLALLTPYDAARLGLIRRGDLADHERTAAELVAAAAKLAPWRDHDAPRKATRAP